MKKYVVFKDPYILIEDVKRRYQPFYKEYPDKVPELCLTSPPLGCPFLKDKMMKFGRKKGAKKRGLCEVCYMKYDDYNVHVLDPEHREFAKDDRNYVEVDKFIWEMGKMDAVEWINEALPDVDKFIGEVLNDRRRS